MADLLTARINMVEGQVKPNRVTDPALLHAMLNIPREDFLPAALHGVAYADRDLPLGGGRFLMQPLVFARLVNEAAVEPDESALVVGCGTGYSAAVLSRLCKRVTAVEGDPALAAAARRILAALPAGGTVQVVEGAPADGYPRGGPYDVILIDGAVADLPAQLGDQLAEDGRLVTVLRDGLVGRGMLYRRVGGLISGREIFDAGTPILKGFEPQPVFQF